MKRPEAAAFIREVLRRTGTTNPSELCRLIDGWNTPTRVRIAYDWYNGLSAPSFGYTFAMLEAAGMVTAGGEEATVSPLAPDSVTARLESLATNVTEIARDQALILQHLGIRGSNAELREARPSQTRARPKRARKSAAR